MKRLSLVVAFFSLAATVSGEEMLKVNLWPGKPPGETKDLPPEVDINKPEDKPVGDRKIIKLTNVSIPTLTFYRPAKEIDTKTCVIICPGGGHNILAYDHEGTEAAEFFAKHGVTGIVLKYRVPFRDPQKRWIAAVQDAQRAVSLVRSKAKEWGLDPNRVGLLGFSAGGQTAGLTAIFDDKRQYEAIDEIDKVSSRPDFAALIYPGGFLEKGNEKLVDYAKPTKQTPPMFLVHAYDDGVDVRNSILLASELKALGVNCELHVYATGGHGYGMRKTGHPVNSWPDRCVEWMTKQGYLKK